jgi:hypothetical protein
MIWIDIKGYKGKYKINDVGYVKNAETNVMIQPNYTSTKLRRVGLYKDQKTKHHFIHKLVYSHFIGEIPDGHYVYHLDGNITNNRVDNLRLRKGKKPKTTHQTRRYPLEIKQQVLSDIDKGVKVQEVLDKYSLSLKYYYDIKKGCWDKYRVNDNI